MKKIKIAVLFPDVLEPAHDPRMNPNRIVEAQDHAFSRLRFRVLPVDLELPVPDHEIFLVTVVVKRRAVSGGRHRDAVREIPPRQRRAARASGDAPDIPVERPVVPLRARLVILTPARHDLGEADDGDGRGDGAGLRRGL
jgi:hypothetical protein